ncbi:MAG TPA: hypothetical protein VFX38_04800, partial [Gammaproteobacteria bacterium]|nr:hypothetical protein [Gammaproteobacteria bacterium]
DDKFAAGFEVTNLTSTKREVETLIRAEGNAVNGQPSAHDRFALASYAHRPFWLNLAAPAPGTIRLTATATAGTLGDAMAATIPVRRAHTPITAAEYGSTTGKKAVVPVKIPPQAIPGATTLSVTLAPTLVGGLANAFVALRDDPIESWEIRLSRAVLASDYLRLKPVLGDSVKWGDAQSAITKSLQAATDFQAPGGGMAFWIPRDDFASPYLSVYTALAFDWLARAGHPVAPTVEARLRAYLRKHVLALDDASSPAAPVLRAAALAALAPAGKLPAGAVAGMIPELPKLRLFGQALLLEAALEVKDEKSAATIAQSILSHAEESAGEISFNERIPGAYLDLLASPLRSNCAALDALVQYAAAHKGGGLVGTTPQKLLRWVIAARAQSGAWPNSQENVFCTTATLHYAALYETPVKRLGATVAAADQTLGKAEFASQSTPARTMRAPAPATSGNFSVTVAPSGAGRLYYNVNLTYALPPASLGPADAGFTLHREYQVERSGKWQPVTADTTLARGYVLRVDLDLDVPTERHHVVLDDPLPGAFEAVNRNLATAMTSTPDAQPDNLVLWFDSGAWPNGTVTTSGFYHRETGFDAVRFFADNLMPGNYHLIYAVQVISPGRFIAPAATVREIYQPDIFGRGSSQVIQVAPPQQ